MSTFAKGNPFSLFFGDPFFWDPFFFFFFGFFLALQRLARLKCNLEPNCKHIWGSLFCSHTPARSVLDFESFAGRGQMLDGRVLGASQAEYNPFRKRPLKRESTHSSGSPSSAWRFFSQAQICPSAFVLRKKSRRLILPRAQAEFL